MRAEAVVTFAAAEGSAEPHILAEPGTRAKALCGYAPYNNWSGYWIRPATDVALAALCAQCRSRFNEETSTTRAPDPDPSPGLFRRLFGR